MNPTCVTIAKDIGLGLIDLTKGVAWPVAAIVIARFFKDEIRAILPRLLKLGPSGLEFAAVAQQSVSVAVPTSPESLQDLPGLSRTRAVTDLELLLRHSINDIPEGQRLDRLLLLLAQARLETIFEQTYAIGFGSQFALLQKLNEFNRLPFADVQKFFETYKQRNPYIYNNYSFDQWLGFLAGQALITFDQDWVFLTNAGRDFLIYLTANQRSLNKQG